MRYCPGSLQLYPDVLSISAGMILCIVCNLTCFLRTWQALSTHLLSKLMDEHTA